MYACFNQPSRIDNTVKTAFSFWNSILELQCVTVTYNRTFWDMMIFNGNANIDGSVLIDASRMFVSKPTMFTSFVLFGTISLESVHKFFKQLRGKQELVRISISIILTFILDSQFVFSLPVLKCQWGLSDHNCPSSCCLISVHLMSTFYIFDSSKITRVNFDLIWWKKIMLCSDGRNVIQ